MIEQLLTNWVCWAIVVVALVAYQQLWEEHLTQTNSLPHNATGGDNDQLKHQFSTLLIGALPLLGLLGTIIGLLDCFASMARDGADATQLSGGIGDALLTTQLGLVCAVPGWLLQSYTRSQQPRPTAAMAAR